MRAEGSVVRAAESLEDSVVRQLNDGKSGNEMDVQEWKMVAVL